MIKLLSSDSKAFTVEKAVAERSVLIKNMLEDIGDDASENPIPLPNVNANILEKVYISSYLFS